MIVIANRQNRVHKVANLLRTQAVYLTKERCQWEKHYADAQRWRHPWLA